LKNITNICHHANFQFKDIENALFNNINPSVVSYPFPFKSLKKISVKYSIPFTIEDTLSPKSLIFFISEINNKKVSVEVFSKKIPFVLFPYVLKDFTKNLITWREYVFHNLKDFCNSDLSIMHWKIINSGCINFVFKDNTIDSLQKLWISVHSNIDREFWLKTATDIKESLHPWLNFELWKSMKEKEEKARKNEDYEKQRAAMIRGEIDKIDVAPDLTKEMLDAFQNIENTDLDIIK
jgi:hypothetical protein